MSSVVLWSWLLSETGNWMHKTLVSIPDCQSLCPRGCSEDFPEGSWGTSQVPSVVSLVTALGRVPSFRSGVYHQNELPWENPSPESAAKEQAPDGRQGSWRWFQFLVDFGQEGPPHLLEEHQRNCQEKAKNRSDKCSIFCDFIFVCF